MEKVGDSDFWVLGRTRTRSWHFELIKQEEVGGLLKLRCCLVCSEETRSGGLGVSSLESGDQTFGLTLSCRCSRVDFGSVES